MGTDVWAAAQAEMNNGNGASVSQGGESSIGNAIPNGGESSLGGAALFGGGKSTPSLFNKSHRAGTERTGVIYDIKDVHSRTHRDQGAQLRYWQEGESAPVTNAVNPKTNEQNRKVMDVFIMMNTSYRMDAGECAMTGRDPAFGSEDDGTRAWVADIAAVKEALKRDAASLGITGPADLIGKRITVKRLTEPGVKGQAWAVKFSAA